MFIKIWNIWGSNLVKFIFAIIISYIFFITKHIPTINIFLVTTSEDHWVNKVGPIEGFSFIFLVVASQIILFLGVLFNIKQIYYLINYGQGPIYNYSPTKAIFYSLFYMLLFGLGLPLLGNFFGGR